MPLNLGNITNDVSDDIVDLEFEDAYVRYIEADHQFMNFMNAIEIAEKAKAAQSTECVSFAEELLGCSLEVLKDRDEEEKRVSNNLIGSTNAAFSSIRGYISFIFGRCIKNKALRARLNKETVTDIKGKKVSVMDALVSTQAELNHFDDKRREIISRNTTKSGFRQIQDIHSDFQDQFSKFYTSRGREDIAYFIREARRILKVAKKIVKEYIH